MRMSNPIDLGETARTDSAASVEQERDAVGDQPDTGGLVPPDHAQAAPAPDESEDLALP